jgi:4-hydroxythreonine-4-phosphate dehydrogenase
MGEPAGIGGDIALTSYALRHKHHLPSFFMIDDLSRLQDLAHLLNLPILFQEIFHPSEAIEIFPEALPVLNCPLPFKQPPGKIIPEHQNYVREAIEKAYHFTQSREAVAMVTNPIEKKALYETVFPFPGHTEFLAYLDQKLSVAMMLAITGLRVVPVTIHCPLNSVSDHLTKEKIIEAGLMTYSSLQTYFKIETPRIAVAALNPHAGEQGQLGSEEIKVIIPAIEGLKHHNIFLEGPFAADSLFYPEARVKYDAVLCMYHDQALIPLKTLDFFSGVNITLGLSVIRTSPDHGTALSLAGTGKARADSFIAALKMADQMASACR